MNKAMVYAYEVYKEKSFSQAAKNLYVSQPALSLAIRKLEEELGVQLFDRSTTPISLTAEGRVYIDTAGKILRLNDQLNSYMSDLRQLRTGQLTLGSPHLFIVQLLPGIIGDFSREYSQVDFTLLEGDTVQLTEMLLNHEIDLMLDTTAYQPELMVHHELFGEQILLAVPASLPLNRELEAYHISLAAIRSGRFAGKDFPAVPLERFRDQHFLMQRKGQDMHDRATALCAAHGFVPQSHLHVNQLVTALDLVRQGRGLTFVSSTGLKTLSSGEGMVFYKLEGELARRKVYISYLKNRYVTQAMQRFVQLATGHAVEAGYPAQEADPL